MLLDEFLECATRTRRQHNTKGFEHPADLVVQAGTHTDQLTARSKKQPDFVARDTFDFDGTIPATARELSDAARVIAVSLVQLRRERCVHVAGMNAINRNTSISQCVIEPYCERASFHSDAPDLGGLLSDDAINSLRIRCYCSAPDGITVPIDYANRR
ncbi:hypothetical protein WS64_25675 [Burkholderia anthina]|uniref:Uncharacterized protein n=1 Tax=Burkholderia anthina TaxID=179879 RepID=A0AAW3PSR6_9BURK|nr:hypothetical protein WS64_25675 [Burkholderia anthina]